MNREEYDKFVNEQMEILRGHTDRIMLRILNKLLEVEKEN